MEEEKPTIAIINSNQELINLFEEIFQEQGYNTVAIQTMLLRSGRVDFNEFITQNNPQAILYDVAIPYEENWEYLKKIREDEVMQGRHIVITSTNKGMLDLLVGEETPAIEVVGKPFDIQEVVDAVKGEPRIRGERES